MASTIDNHNVMIMVFSCFLGLHASLAFLAEQFYEVVWKPALTLIHISCSLAKEASQFELKIYNMFKLKGLNNKRKKDSQ